jgi:hypothetical protein
MKGALKGSLLRAVKTAAQEAAGEGSSADQDVMKKLAKRQNLAQLTAAAKQTKDVAKLLEDPKLPSIQDLDRWWPDPVREKMLSPLVPFAASPTRGATASALLPAALMSIERRSPTTRSPTRSGARSPEPRSPVNMRSISQPAFAGQLSSTARYRTPLSDPSRLSGNPDTLELPESIFAPEASDAFEETPVSPHPRRTLELLDRDERLNHWMSAFEMDEVGFKSKAVFVEMRLRQVRRQNAHPGMLRACHMQ